MKKALSILFAAIFLLATASVTLAQKAKAVTANEANELLQKTAGSWQIDFSLWQAKTKNFLTSKGDASISKLKEANYVREQYKITLPDGTVEEGEGFLSYSSEKKRFELVQVDNSGNGTVLLTGEYFPENKTLVMSPASGMEQWVNGNKALMQLHYTFFEDGSFMKAYRMPDAKGNYTLVSQYHYKTKS